MLLFSHLFIPACLFAHLHTCTFADTEKFIYQNVYFCVSACKGKEEKPPIFLLALSGSYLP
ncbi:MAG: hypothetical protein LBH32_10130 [Dysgonamonadaceae bacterium]|jgi:hypothetical protein|nr:hypothetical protein [Dysgonamonadaceae bacterium]